MAQHLSLEVFDEMVAEKTDRQKRIIEWKAEAALIYEKPKEIADYVRDRINEFEKQIREMERRKQEVEKSQARLKVDLEIKQKEAEVRLELSIERERHLTEIKLKREKDEAEIKSKRERDEAEIKLLREKQEIEMTLEKYRKDVELTERELRFRITNEQNKFQHEKEIEMIRQQGQSDRQSISQTSSNTSIHQTDKIKIDIPMLESLDLKLVDEYLERFERAMCASDVPSTEWGKILTLKLDIQFNRVINSIPYEDIKNYQVIVREIRKQFALDSSYYQYQFKSQVQSSGESTLSFFQRSNAALFKWLASENIEIDSEAHQQIRTLLDFIIKDQYMTKIASAKEKVIFIKQHPTKSLQELATIADLYDNSHNGANYVENNIQEKESSNNKTYKPYKSIQGEQFRPNGREHKNWNTENEFPYNTEKGSRNNQHGNYNSRAMNALAIDQGNRQNQKCSLCFRTNHTDKDCYYKPVNGQNNNNNRQFRNQNGPNQRRNEYVRYMEGQNIDQEDNQPGQEGITFNRSEEIQDNNTHNHRETNNTEFNDYNRQHHSVYATFVEGLPEYCEEATGYGHINGIPSRVIRDSGATRSFISSKLVKKENYTGEEVTVDLAEGRSQVRPIAVVPVDTPFFTGDLTCIVSENAKHELLIGNYNANQNEKIGGCKFNRIYDDREFKERYEKRKKFENENGSSTMKSRVQNKNNDYVCSITENSNYKERKIEDISRARTIRKEEYQLHNRNYTSYKNELNMRRRTNEVNMRTYKNTDFRNRNTRYQAWRSRRNENVRFTNENRSSLSREMKLRRQMGNESSRRNSRWQEEERRKGGQTETEQNIEYKQRYEAKENMRNKSFDQDRNISRMKGWNIPHGQNRNVFRTQNKMEFQVNDRVGY